MNGDWDLRTKEGKEGARLDAEKAAKNKATQKSAKLEETKSTPPPKSSTVFNPPKQVVTIPRDVDLSKAPGPIKKDGTLDMRYSENKVYV